MMNIKPQDYTKLSQVERRLLRYEYAKAQGGKCYHCGKLLNYNPTQGFMTDHPINWSLFPKGFLDYPVHLHHNHETGLTIGAVHAYCNAILFQHHGE